MSAFGASSRSSLSYCSPSHVYVRPPSVLQRSLPADLYIIATMNNADRSIEPIDAAMRRRFQTVTFDFCTEPFEALLRAFCVESLCTALR